MNPGKYARLPAPCARTACRALGPRFWWNTSTRAYYCTGCAWRINETAPGLCVEVLAFDKWPHGPPISHQALCSLFEGGTKCDCSASNLEQDLEWRQLRDARDLAQRRLAAAQRMRVTAASWDKQCAKYEKEIADCEELMAVRQQELSL